VAERLRWFRGQRLTDGEIRRADGRRYALASIEDAAAGDIVDLDDPAALAHRDLRPSQVATGNRGVTRPIALALFEEGVAGFAWWSTLEASWPNVTLFAERAWPGLSVAAPPQPLSVDLPVVKDAAEGLGIPLG
jgi:hypothetical protein